MASACMARLITGAHSADVFERLDGIRVLQEDLAKAHVALETGVLER